MGAYALMPGAAPGRSALWLFTTKKIEVPCKGFCVSRLMVGQDCHVAVGTYVYPVAAMRFWQALTWPSFSTMVGQGLVAVGTYVHPVAAMSCGQALTLPSLSTPNKGMAYSTMRQSSGGDAAH